MPGEIHPDLEKAFDERYRLDYVTTALLRHYAIPEGLESELVLVDDPDDENRTALEVVVFEPEERLDDAEDPGDRAVFVWVEGGDPYFDTAYTGAAMRLDISAARLVVDHGWTVLESTPQGEAALNQYRE